MATSSAGLIPPLTMGDGLDRADDISSSSSMTVDTNPPIEPMAPLPLPVDTSPHISQPSRSTATSTMIAPPLPNQPPLPSTIPSSTIPKLKIKFSTNVIKAASSTSDSPCVSPPNTPKTPIQFPTSPPVTSSQHTSANGSVNGAASHPFVPLQPIQNPHQYPQRDASDGSANPLLEVTSPSESEATILLPDASAPSESVSLRRRRMPERTSRLQLHSPQTESVTADGIKTPATGTDLKPTPLQTTMTSSLSTATHASCESQSHLIFHSASSPDTTVNLLPSTSPDNVPSTNPVLSSQNGGSIALRGASTRTGQATPRPFSARPPPTYLAPNHPAALAHPATVGPLKSSSPSSTPSASSNTIVPASSNTSVQPAPTTRARDPRKVSALSASFPSRPLGEIVQSAARSAAIAKARAKAIAQNAVGFTDEDVAALEEASAKEAAAEGFSGTESVTRSEAEFKAIDIGIKLGDNEEGDLDGDLDEMNAANGDLLEGVGDSAGGGALSGKADPLKRAKKRERNRVAAALYRKRHKNHVRFLERYVGELEKQLDQAMRDLDVAKRDAELNAREADLEREKGRLDSGAAEEARMEAEEARMLAEAEVARLREAVEAAALGNVDGVAQALRERVESAEEAGRWWENEAKETRTAIESMQARLAELEADMERTRAENAVLEEELKGGRIRLAELEADAARSAAASATAQAARAAADASAITQHIVRMASSVKSRITPSKRKIQESEFLYVPALAVTKGSSAVVAISPSPRAPRPRGRPRKVGNDEDMPESAKRQKLDDDDRTAETILEELSVDRASFEGMTVDGVPA
ncbi:hypothetical protein HDU93_000002 [Gonapodya sp. JEL0774]|nr:hypothetical protein HDU93_000002 [Gonapodya sp. JEL0774]